MRLAICTFIFVIVVLLNNDRDQERTASVMYTYMNNDKVYLTHQQM